MLSMYLFCSGHFLPASPFRPLEATRGTGYQLSPYTTCVAGRKLDLSASQAQSKKDIDSFELPVYRYSRVLC